MKIIDGGAIGVTLIADAWLGFEIGKLLVVSKAPIANVEVSPALALGLALANLASVKLARGARTLRLLDRMKGSYPLLHV